MDEATERTQRKLNHPIGFEKSIEAPRSFREIRKALKPW
jgi:hypothetical protein